MPTATEILQEQRERDLDERSLHKRVAWFSEKWTTQMDLNKRDAAELHADFTLVLQAVYRDASRDTHALLTRAMSTMPPPTFIIEKKD